MTPRYADVRGVLERYPNVTNEEQRALWQWYGNARAVELVDVLNDPRLERPLHKLHRDFPHQMWKRLCFSAVALTLIAIAVALAA